MFLLYSSRWGVGGGSQTQHSSSLWPHTALCLIELREVYSKHLQGIGLLTVFALDFIRSAYMKWQHMKQSISFGTRTSVLKLQGQCLAHHKAPYMEPGCARAHVPQVWHCTLCSPTLSKVPPTANRTPLLLRQTLKNVSGHIALNTCKLIKEKKLTKISGLPCLFSSCLTKTQE